MDIISKSKVMIIISVIAILIGLFSIVFHKGLKYGTDFSGGTSIVVKLNENISSDKLELYRKMLGEDGIKANLVIFGQDADEQNRLKITTESDTNITDKIKTIFEKITQVSGNKIDINQIKLNKNIAEDFRNMFVEYTLKKINENKPFKNAADFLNKVSAVFLSEEEISKNFVFESEGGITEIRDNLNNLSDEELETLFVNLFSSKKYKDMFNVLGDNINDFIDGKGGIISDINDLKTVINFDDELFGIFSSKFTAGSFIIESNNMVGPTIGADYRKKAMFAIVFALIGMLIYITWRFEFRFAVGAIIALIHDVLITIGIFSLLEKEFTTQIIAAILTIVGYSLNDTIVIFDRIRENIQILGTTNIKNTVNKSIMQSLSRTLMTSITTLIAVIALYVFGGEVYRDFAFALLIGVVVGTYSSIFIASPVVVNWKSSK